MKTSNKTSPSQMTDWEYEQHKRKERKKNKDGRNLRKNRRDKWGYE